MMEYRCNMCLH